MKPLLILTLIFCCSCGTLQKGAEATFDDRCEQVCAETAPAVVKGVLAGYASTVKDAILWILGVLGLSGGSYGGWKAAHWKINRKNGKVKA